MSRTVALTSLIILSFLTGCGKVPGSYRLQLKMISARREMELGREVYANVKQDSLAISSGPQAEMLQSLGKKLADAAIRLFPNPAERFEWETILIDDPETINGWCLPGGKIAVYTGILPITQDETYLAALIGHAVAHAVAHHSAERMNQHQITSL